MVKSLDNMSHLNHLLFKIIEKFRNKHISLIVSLLSIKRFLFSKFKENTLKLTKDPYEKRMALVYDLVGQPLAIGDFLILLQAGLSQAFREKINGIDLFIFYNPEHPFGKNKNLKKLNYKDKILSRIFNIMPLVEFNFYIKNIYVVDSISRLNTFIDKNYYSLVFPSKNKIYSEVYLFYEILENIFSSKWFSSTPKLKPSNNLSKEAKFFFNKHAEKSIRVTVNLRNNKSYDVHRNALLIEWINFFKYCHDKYNATFFILSSKEELDSRLLNLPNVIVTRQFYDGIEKDLSLIFHSDIHIGSSSGPSTIAWFQNKPMLIINSHMSILSRRLSKKCIIKNENYSKYNRFLFSSENHIFSEEKETFKTLRRDFDLLVKILNSK